MKKSKQIKTEENTVSPVEGLPVQPSGDGNSLHVPAPEPFGDREALIGSALESVEEGLLILDLNSTVVAANRKFIEMFGIEHDPLDEWPSAAALTRQLAACVTDSDKFIELMQYSVEFPDEITVDTIYLRNNSIVQRRSSPNIVNGVTVGSVISFRDITDSVVDQGGVQDSETLLKALFETNPYPIWIFDAHTLQFLAVNQAAIRKYGYTRAQFLKMTLKDIRPSEDLGKFAKYISATRSLDHIVKTTRHRKKDGSIIDVEISAQMIFFNGRRARIAVVTDLTRNKVADEGSRKSETRLRSLLDSMTEGLVQVDTDDRILYANNRFCSMTGYAAEELIGRAWSEMLVDKSPEFAAEMNQRRMKGLSDRYEIRIRKKGGEPFWTIIGGAPIRDAAGNLTGSMGIVTDISERKIAEEQLLHDALHDGLTGLANRTLFMDHLRRMIDRGNRNKKPFAVLYLDFDRFKVINDSLGHAEGDRLLKFIARRLENCTRTGDIVARLGGDEFVILLHELVDTSEALLVAERIQSDLKLSFDLGGREIYTTTSIGIALSTTGHTKAEDMLRDADIAMYYAKAKGKAQYQIFDASMLQQASKKLQIETEMRLAIANNDFRIYYQPIVSLSTGELVGFESLLRWEHRERGLISPDEFIPIAEETGMILKLGAWAVEESCRQLHEWQLADPRAANVTISVNLSSKEFLQPDLVEKISSTLKAADLAPRFLKIEITESHIMENSELAVKIIHQLRDLGIEMSLDDFGTGYSSLSYLHRLPVSYLKIDRSFVTRMAESSENREIVHTIVRLAQNLKMNVIAEGIESMEQLTELSEMGCDFGQGYLFAPPLDGAAAKQFIAQKGIATAIAPVSEPVSKPEMVM